ncbi:baseplate J/gp47 family protein [Stenotrophomonas sepilia]|uniref:Baseplate J/gp47 family protein n=1 Tax=Stenotrophomonas sepilia TaxID=2860290 RepID=A0ABQ6Q9Y9_9GAMM|nr:baseplate J/gp47 family protein [Stenotrophomonas sepilia]
MSTFTAVDLSRLPLPDVFEQLDFEQLLAQRVAEFKRYMPEYDALVESDPVYKVLQASAYRELTLREQFNQRAKGLFLAYAQRGDLDNLAAPFGVTRKQLTPPDPEAGTPAQFETDTEFRRRIQLAPEGLSVAGPEGAYIFHTLSADNAVLDASATSPAPGEVVVTVLARDGDGTPSDSLLATVNAVLQDGQVRPLTDFVRVVGAQILPYVVEADLYTFDGPDAAVVIAEARRRLEAFMADSHRLGRDVAMSAIYAQLHAEGVQRVVLHAPVADLAVERHQAAYCTVLTLNHRGSNE